MRYVLIDRITELTPGRSLSGIKNVTVSDDLTTSYTPGLTALPAAMVLEAMAQAVGALVMATIDFSAQPVLAKVQPFAAYGHARPGDQIMLSTELEDLRAEGCRARATAEVGGSLLAEATIYLALVPFESGNERERGGELRAHVAGLFPDWFSVTEEVEVVQ